MDRFGNLRGQALDAQFLDGVNQHAARLERERFALQHNRHFGLDGFVHRHRPQAYMADARGNRFAVYLAQQRGDPLTVQFHFNQVGCACVVQHAPQRALLELHGHRLAVGAEHHPRHMPVSEQSPCLLA
jgi:hypothetical protein